MSRWSKALFFITSLALIAEAVTLAVFIVTDTPTAIAVTPSTEAPLLLMKAVFLAWIYDKMRGQGD